MRGYYHLDYAKYYQKKKKMKKGEGPVTRSLFFVPRKLRFVLWRKEVYWFMSVNWKVIGVLAMVGTAALSLLSDVVEEKKMEKTIEEKVDEALSKRESEES